MLMLWIGAYATIASEVAQGTWRALGEPGSDPFRAPRPDYTTQVRQGLGPRYEAS